MKNNDELKSGFKTETGSEFMALLLDRRIESYRRSSTFPKGLKRHS